METVVVTKAELLEKVKENRNLHRKVFEEALVGYRDTAIKHLDEQLERAKAGKAFNTYIQLSQPEDQTRDYDRIITMLEMSVDTETELSEQEFAQYVMDDWHWSKNFWASNAMYSATACSEWKSRS